MQNKYKTSVWKPFQKENYYSAWKTNNVIGIFQEFFRDLRRCYERIHRGYCDYDIFAINDWFLGLMPVMLEDFKDHLHGCPIAPDSISQQLCLGEEATHNEAMKKWRNVLNRMIFLLKEGNEETCTRKNLYYDEYYKAFYEFEEKYGSFGEKLLTEEEKKGPGIRWHMMDEIEEYKPISNLFFEEEEKLDKYRKDCRDEALSLFSKWFDALWD